MDPNVKHDARHLQPTSIKRPEKAMSFSVVRCENCQRLTTEWEIVVHGACPDCANIRFRGGSPKKGWETAKVFLLNAAHHWKVWGPDGWGWQRAIDQLRKQRGI